MNNNKWILMFLRFEFYALMNIGTDILKKHKKKSTKDKHKSTQGLKNKRIFIENLKWYNRTA